MIEIQTKVAKIKIKDEKKIKEWKEYKYIIDEKEKEDR